MPRKKENKGRDERLHQQYLANGKEAVEKMKMWKKQAELEEKSKSLWITNERS